MDSFQPVGALLPLQICLLVVSFTLLLVRHPLELNLLVPSKLSTDSSILARVTKPLRLAIAPFYASELESRVKAKADYGWILLSYNLNHWTRSFAVGP
jgi:hypothetical protein